MSNSQHKLRFGNTPNVFRHHKTAWGEGADLRRLTTSNVLPDAPEFSCNGLNANAVFLEYA